MTATTVDNMMSASDEFGAAALKESGWDESTSELMPQAGSSSSGQSRRAIRTVDVAEVTAQMAIMTKSGVDLASSLSSLVSQCQRPALKDVLVDVRESVMAGNAFSEALKHHPSVFDPTFIATVAAGEASGRMSEVLDQLANMQKNVIRRGREIRALLTYPILLFAVSSAVLAALVLFVLPRFTEIFDQYNMPLPAITQFFLAVSDELLTRWWLWGPLVVSVFVAFFVWKKSAGGRESFDRFWIQSPVVGEICCGMCIGATCRLLGLMLENGVTLLDSLRLTRHAIRNSLYQRLLSDLEDAVVNGQGLAHVLQEADVVPASAKEMIVTAERTGNLNEVTGILGDYYEEESEAKLRQLVATLEPLITVVMGAIVAVVVLAVMLPVFNLSTFAAGGR